MLIVGAINDFEAWEKREEAARKQAAEPHFSTRNNPLVIKTPAEAAQQVVVDRNLQALYRDAEARENPRSGAVYSGIMNMRYGG